MKPVNIALVGIGYWGPNLARNFNSISEANLYAICDCDQKLLEKFNRLYPETKMTTEFNDLLSDPHVEAIVLATPSATHYQLAKAALKANKHVFVEKPLVQTVVECQELVELAEEMNLTLMVGHVFMYNAAVRKIKEYIDNGELGDIYYIYSQRLNLGTIRSDANALWNFAPHDFSILAYWIGEPVSKVSAIGHAFIQPEIEDVVFVNLSFPGGITANVHISWLDPCKERKMTIVGSKKMVVYDDVSTDAKITIYDRGFTKEEIGDVALGKYETFGEFQLLKRAGDVLIPKIDFIEPLKTECQHFAVCIRNQQSPITDGRHGLMVTEMLEAAHRSMRANA